MGDQVRRKEIRRRRARVNKLRSLRERYGKAKTESERTAILAKLKRIHPALSKEQFVAPLERRQTKAA